MESCSETNRAQTREELRRKLRNRIKEKRNLSSSDDRVKQMKEDPKSTLLSLGVDDPELLKNADSLLKNPIAALQTLTQKVKEMQTQAKSEHESDDEELPPPE